MQNLLDSDAFVVAILLLILGTLHLATDEDARNGLVDLVAEVRSGGKETAPNTAEPSSPKLQDAPTEQPSPAMPPITTATKPTKTNGLVAQAPVQHWPVIYPVANATPEATGMWQFGPSLDSDFITMVTGHHCGDPNCPRCMEFVYRHHMNGR